MSVAEGWLGYPLDRSRGRVAVRSLGDRVLLLGRQAGAIATLYAYACAESGLKLAILDVDGSLSQEVHGYFTTSDYRTRLYEAFHLEGEGLLHGQLVASAYSAALDLSPEEEAIISSAMQALSVQNDLAAPAPLYDAVGASEGFRGFYVDKLKGRIAALKHLDSTRVEGFDGLMRGGELVSFASAPYPQAAELAACAYIAKVVHLLHTSTTRPGALLVTGAHRLFGNLTRYQHAGRLMTYLLEAPVPVVIATPLPALLNELLLESMPVRVYSSEAWNAKKDAKRAPAMASSYTICDDRNGTSTCVVPRFVRPSIGNSDVAPAPFGRASSGLTMAILEEISKFDSANRQSLVSYLAPEYLAGDVGAELDRLHSQGYLIMEPKQDGGGPMILGYTVTEAGRRLLRELSG